MRRAAIFALALCFAVVFTLPGAYFHGLAPHKHDHLGINGSCSTCTHLQMIENQLKQAKMPARSVPMLNAFSNIYALPSPAALLGFETLVTAKIRMND